MEQTQIAAVVAPAATVAAKPEKKATAKRTTRTAPAKKETPATIGFLPSATVLMSGHFLASFTRAWMEITGFIDGKPVETKMIHALMGSGVRYHEKKERIQKSDKGYVITPEGKTFFLTRDTIVPNPEFVEAYKALLTKGTPDKKIRIDDASKVKKIA